MQNCAVCASVKNRRWDRLDPSAMLLFKCVSSLAVVGLVCRGDGLGPFRLIQRVGIELCLQADTAPEVIGNTALSGLAQQEVACVELNAAAIGGHFHSPAGYRKNGTGIAPDLEVVIIAVLELQGIIVLVNIPADGLGGAEIHGCALHASLFAGGNVFCIVRAEMPGRHHKDLFHCLLGLIVAEQVKIAMVCILIL